MAVFWPVDLVLVLGQQEVGIEERLSGEDEDHLHSASSRMFLG